MMVRSVERRLGVAVVIAAVSAAAFIPLAASGGSASQHRHAAGSQQTDVATGRTAYGFSASR